MTTDNAGLAHLAGVRFWTASILPALMGTTPPFWLRPRASRSPDAERWPREERRVCLKALRRARRPTVFANALEDIPSEGVFGGAMTIGADGQLSAESPHGTDEMLAYDFGRGGLRIRAGGVRRE